MCILGYGVDIVELGRVERLLASPDNDWLLAVFSPDEQRAADAPPARVRYFAGRYAAKEAVAKALGTGISGDIAWTDIEVLREPTGAPIVRISGGALNAASGKHISRWLISISHTGEYAVASAIAVGD